MSKVLIGLPASRAAQLKAIASVRGLSVNDLLTAVIESSVQSGEIADQTPGFEISASGHGSGRTISMNLDHKPLPALTLENALDIAQALEGIANRAWRERWIAIVSPHLLFITRVGTGIALEFSSDGGEKIRATVTPSIARDLARQLRAAAA
jgi:hypothetical protein